jgi:hypothetical protein
MADERVRIIFHIEIAPEWVELAEVVMREAAEALGVRVVQSLVTKPGGEAARDE